MSEGAIGLTLVSTDDAMREALAWVQERDVTIEELKRSHDDFAESVKRIAENADAEIERYRKIIAALTDPTLPWIQIKDGERVLTGGHLATPAELTRLREELAKARAEAKAMRKRILLLEDIIEGITSQAMRASPIEGDGR